MSRSNSGPRAVIIGLDGATFNFIKPLIVKNELPFFQRLMSDGSYGVLDSDLPVNSAANWTSLFTGKNPGKHNIFDYLAYDNSSYQARLITNQSLKSHQLWNIANQNDLRTILINAPVASAPEPLNGIMVSGLLTPSTGQYAYPDAIVRELESDNYLIDSGSARRLDAGQYYDQIMKTLVKQEETFQKLIDDHHWDLAILTLNALGKAQHDFWLDNEKIEALYRQIDSFLNRIFKSIDEETYFIIVSHHGFKSVTKKFFVNEWLWERGLLKKAITINQSRLTDVNDIIFNHVDQNSNLLTQFFAKTGITKDHIRSFIPEFITESFKRFVPWSIKKYFPREYLDIDWSKTRAYFVSANVQGININLKGREPQGIVREGAEYERLRDRIIAELYRLKDPYTLEDVVDEIYRREDVFKGDYVKSAPDIVFVPHHYDYYPDPNKRTCRLVIGAAIDDYPVYSYHEPRGIFFISGPDIKRGNQIANIDIYDVAPTVLHLFDISKPADMDGRVLNSIFQGMSEYGRSRQPFFLPYEDRYPLISEEHFNRQSIFNPATP